MSKFNKTATRFSTLRNSACAAAMLMALSACVPTDNASDEMDKSQEFVRSQSEFYASALQQYSMRSQHAVTNAASWAAGGISEGRLDMTSASFGVDLGSSEAFIESGYCRTSADKALHFTWLDTEDTDGEFSLKGIGEGNTGFVVSALTSLVDSENIGIYQSGGIKMVSGNVKTFPTGCPSLNIPTGAPVLVLELSLPTGFDKDMDRFEYRTVSCPSGEAGAIQQQIQVTYHPDGGRTPAGGVRVSAGSDVNFADDDTLSWVTVSNSCASAISLVSYDVSVGSAEGLDASALYTDANLNSGNQIANLLENALSDVECRRVLERIEEGEEVDNPDRQLFETCGVSVDLAALQSIQATAQTLIKEETVTKPCGGSAGTFEDSVDGDVGVVTHPAWTGDAVYKRETWSYTVNTNLSGGPGPGCGSCEETKTREKWTGISLDCTREEMLDIECATRLPKYSDREVYTVIDDEGFIYNRHNDIYGWLDAENLVPNEPTNPTWTGYSFGCEWRKDVDFDCSAYPELRQIRIGEANRIVKAVDIAGTVEAGSWTVSQTAQCGEDATWGCDSLGAGYTEEREGVAVKITEILDPEGATEVHGWTVSATAQCSETRTFSCSGTKVRDGVQKRITEILDPTGAKEVGDWTTTTTAQCTQTRTVTGCETRVERRTYTGTAPGEGSWSGWTVVSSVNNCVTSGPTGGGSGGGGGGDVCIMAGASVPMADGSFKKIENLEVGDVTVAGRVLQKFARHYDPSRHLTDAGRFLVGESLFNVDGIVATGRHSFLSKAGWTELSDCPYAEAVSEDVEMLYNMVMENHVIPLMGDSGQVHYYADELNNLGGISEQAMDKINAVSATRIAA